MSVLNKHAQIKEKRVKRTSKPVWLTEKITNAQQNRNYYHKKHDWKILSSGAIRLKISFALPKKVSSKMQLTTTKIVHFVWKHVKDITGQSNSNRIPSALHSEEGQLNTPPEIISEMNLYFTKVSDRLVKDKRPFNYRNAVNITEYVNSRKPENVHFKVPLIKSDELKSILKSLDPSKSTGIIVISPKNA